MKNILTSIVTAFALAGCGVSPANQQALANLQVECAAGNPDACTAAGYQAQANQQEAQANQAAAANVGAAILAGAAAGAIIANQHPVYVYHPYSGWRR